MGAARYDLFVSYAHADDEVPAGATKGWVTTLADELNKVLRRKLGSSGATIWMDHQLAANTNVSDTLFATLRSSQTLLLVMSPGYQRSAWCQRELGNFLAQATSQKSRDNVFIVDAGVSSCSIRMEGRSRRSHSIVCGLEILSPL